MLNYHPAPLANTARELLCLRGRARWGRITRARDPAIAGAGGVINTLAIAVTKLSELRLAPNLTEAATMLAMT